MKLLYRHDILNKLFWFGRVAAIILLFIRIYGISKEIVIFTGNIVNIKYFKTSVKLLVRRVLSDRYRIPHEKFQYQRVDILMMFQVYTLCKSH